MATMTSSMLKTNPLLLSSKPRVNFTESSRFASVKVESFVNFASISASQNTVRGRPFNFEARFKTPSSKGNNFEQAAVIPEGKDVLRTRVIKLQVTILVAAKGKTVLKFPSTIDSNEDLKKALKELQTISESAEIQAVNVLWSPQDGNEVMSCEELNEEYPLLCRIGGGDY
ncbi:hypothetical protein LWI28_002210 [Acer negundo]|uniref:Uncharacterized protein n=1 Tax=Acer negundo TaxID=4023 RepID=A0AAD5IY83_ACENE|nr:hypothetical protein LWI28_002210 [Acer negundo]